MTYSAVPRPAIDTALVAQLEAAHEWAVHNFVISVQERRPALQADAISIAGGRALYVGPSPFSFAVNLGIGRPVTPRDLDQVEHFYAQHGVPTKVDVTPATHRSLSQLIQERGYRVADLTAVLVLDAQNADIAPPAPEIQLRWARAEDCDLWVDTVAHNFFVTEPGRDRRNNIACVFHAPHALNVIAMIDGKVAGVAGCMIPHNGGMAIVYASCTVLEYRRKGVHREMLRLRVNAARAAGCDAIMATALPGSDSERNLVRCGFDTCYVKTTWAK